MERDAQEEVPSTVKPFGFNNREKDEPPDTLISIVARPSILPINPFSACAFAISMSFGVKVNLSRA